MSSPAPTPVTLPDDEGWFRTLAEAAAVAIYLYHRGRFIYVNPASSDLTGYSEEELRNIGPEQLIHGDDWEMATAEERRRRAPDPPNAPFEIRIHHRDGSLRWIACSTRSIELGAVRLGLGIGVDVTPRHRAEDALRKRVELETSLSALAHRFIRLRPDELDAGLEMGLEELGLLAGADRTHLHLFAEDGRTVVQTRDWCADGVALEPDAAAPVSLDEVPWAAARLEGGTPVVIDDVAALPDAGAADRAMFTALGVRAMVCVPVLASGKLLGVLGFDSLTDVRRWDDNEVQLLELAAEIFASALQRSRAELAARRGSEWLELAQRAGRSIAWEWQPDGDRMNMSPFAAEFFGYPADMLPTTGKELVSVIPAEDRLPLAETLRRTLRSGSHFTVEHRVLLPDGDMRWLVVRGQAMRGPGGRVERVIGVSADITGRKQAEAALLAEKEYAQVTLASIGDGVIRTDRLGHIDYLNPTAEKLTGVTLTEAMGRPVTGVYRVLDEGGRQPRRDPVAECLSSGRVVTSSERGVLLRSDGGEFAVRDSAAPVRDRDGAVIGAVLVFQDISELRGLEREMAYLASHDPLTGLYNRHVFERQLAKALDSAHKGGRRHVLCFLDLDEFKIVNDTCGHVAGDELLRQLGALLSGTVREGDVLARLGGDEFGVLLRDCSLHHARRIATKLLETIRGFRFSWEDRVFDVGASIGVVPLAGDAFDLSHLMSAADSACYVAKDRGRNQVHVWEPDDTEVAAWHTEMQWIEHLERALDEGRLRLFSQEIRPLLDNRRPLAELLLRLVGSDGEVVPASQFITAAERYHLMPKLDRWVVDAAAAIVARDHDPALRYTVNLSGQSLEDESFLEFVRSTLARHGVAPDRICFELSETAVISHLEQVRRVMQGLRDDGCSLVVDDFGSALSSFTCLRTLPVEFIKIDGSLVGAVGHDPVRREMVAAVHRVARLMGIWTIAEAVEATPVLDGLREVGVDYAQGYLIGQPQPVDNGSPV